MTDYQEGQRWISETEPELGLGVLRSASGGRLSIDFPASEESRLYAAAHAPIKRVAFRAGDTIRAADGRTLQVESVGESDGLLTYRGSGDVITEAELADTISFSKPEDRLAGGRVDRTETFSLRYATLRYLGAARQSEVSGFAGGRIDLIPHQLYVAAEVAERHRPRVLLADEVGLGKTIEACLILHRLHLTGRAERVLVLVPEPLVHQWFIELLRRFNLWFVLFDAERGESLARSNSEGNPFLEDQLVICALPTLLEDARWARHAMEADWDMLVVDEAHHLAWSPEQPSREYQLVEGLAQRSGGVLLLTATPEQLGAEGHFARLRLLDPERYPDLEQFKREQAKYAEVAAAAEDLSRGQVPGGARRETVRRLFEEYTDAEFAAKLEADPSGLVEDLVDRHGTGRVIFRNTREALTGFPGREARPAPLQPRQTLSEAELHARLLREFDWESDGDGAPPGKYDFRHGPRIRWLADLLRELDPAKVLLISRTPEKARALQTALAEELNVKAAAFHEELSLMQRDRAAAWFADPDGARILLCSEIGSEGRNFQFAHHLVLFDLPLDPELLEQRIGRLDRIGQTETIRVHLPYLRGSCTELLVRWHHEGLDGVEHSLKGGNAYLERFGQELRRLAPVYHLGDPGVRGEAEALVAASREYREKLEQQLGEGQDRLIALNSFRADTAEALRGQIRELDADRTLDAYMNRVFDHFGVTVEDIAERTFHLAPGQLFTDSFPDLPEEGTVMTCERSRALSREDIGFLTWDHPMVRGAMDLILGSEQGNSAVVVWEPPPVGLPAVLLEAIFVLESVAPRHLHVDRFLPPTAVRVVVDARGAERTSEYSSEQIDAGARDEPFFRVRQRADLVREALPSMADAARGYAREVKHSRVAAAAEEAHRRLDGEAERLRSLREVNPGVREEEIALAEQVVSEVTRHIGEAHLRLDAVRLILRGDGA